MGKVSITELGKSDLTEFLKGEGEREYRARQILDWVYRKPVNSFEAMSNLPPALRDRLESEFEFQSVTPLQSTTSRDKKTTKVLFQLQDGRTIESVLMRYEKRRTVCVSSQVGCAFGCPLCATGSSGFERNLTPGEIVDQVLHFSRQLIERGQAVSNIVYMGMGEPLVNFEAVWRSIETFTDPALMGIGARHITISTSGIAPGIRKLSRKKLQVGLAVSLHAPDNELRDMLVPPNRLYPLEVLLPACKQYVAATRRRITFEYVIIRNLNDSPQHAAELGNLLRGIDCHVNIIPFNPAEDSEFRPPARPKIQYFSELLQKHHVPNTVRMRRGTDIEAGCGQLRARVAGT